MSEVLALSDAIARFVRPGATMALEGFTHLIPFAAGHEIIRQVVGDLTLIRMTPDLLCDQMIGAGCARRLVFSCGGSIPSRLTTFLSKTADRFLRRVR